MYGGVALAILALFFIAIVYARYFGPVDSYAGKVKFIVEPGQTEQDVSNNLKSEGFIRSRLLFDALIKGTLHGGKIRPGGYELSASMDMWSLTSTLARPPYFVFFTFPPGWRKEQIADKLADTFNWTPVQKSEWINVDTNTSASYAEGVYFPDTYFIPSDQKPSLVAQQFRANFQQEYAPYADVAQKEGLQWTDVVILASLLEREAAGAQDMSLIAGIMLNRLKVHMPLQIDATLQYMNGKEGNWWPVPQVADKSIESPFNTYLHAGLPPHAISEPGLGAIKAVLNAQKTDCLYYLHDSKGQIHCSPTYAGQIANIKKYLK